MMQVSQVPQAAPRALPSTEREAFDMWCFDYFPHGQEALQEQLWQHIPLAYCNDPRGCSTKGSKLF